MTDASADDFDPALPIADHDDVRRSHRERKTRKALELGAERWTGAERVEVQIGGEPCEREPFAVWANRYALTRELGEGGMAVVYEAFEATNDFRKAFALKIIKDEFKGYLVERELESLRRLEKKVRSPYVVQVDAVESSIHCIRMQLLQGTSLRHRLKNCGRIIAPFELLRIGRDVAEALTAVHGAGVIHRDIKPENIFLAQEDGLARAVLLDFGIAIQSETVRTMREATPGYAPPEADFTRTDQESRQNNDLYMLGKVLFEMLTGSLPGSDVLSYPTPFPVIRDYAYSLFHDKPERRPHSAQVVADQLRLLAEQELPSQLPEILHGSLKIVRQIAREIMAAHRDGFPHRAATVENVHGTADGQARLLGPVDAESTADCDEARDVYDLGRSLYSFVVGDFPKPGTSYAEFAKARKLDLPPEFLRTIGTLCAANPRNRLASVADVSDQLYRLEGVCPR